MRVSQLGQVAAMLYFGMMVSSASSASAVQAFTPEQSAAMKKCLETNNIKTGANLSGFTEAQKAAVNKCQTIALGKTSVAPSTAAKAAVKPKPKAEANDAEANDAEAN